ncbi:MAG: DNA-directed RNA polymerase subunit alpha C-terminal domain-containing protein [Gemmataceae bacterium]
MLAKVRSAYVVGLHAVTEMHGRAVLVLDKAGDQTLAAHLREFGRCDLEWQERFGTDLLQALCDLEQAGVFHRDVKPDNIGIRDGRQRRQLVLFDFSLARAPLDNLRVGTPPYLDPFLPLRTPPRWDPAAERYAAAVTLYEMATGGLPRYGDGRSDPALTADEFSPDLAAMDPPVRAGLEKFFRQALHRDPAVRFDSGERMKRAWAKVFDEADQATVAVAGMQVEVAVRLEEVRPDTFVELLGLSARARGALERLGVATVRDFLGRTVPDFQFQPNVGAKTRRELVEWLGRLRVRFPDEAALAAARVPAVSEDVTRLGLVALRDRLVGKATARDKRAYQIRCRLLGLEGGTAAADGSPAWPPLTEVADRLAISRQRVHQVLLSDRVRWDRDPAVQPLREEVVGAVYKAGGVLTGRELAEVIVAGRGIDELAEADRPKVAAALARVVYEAEQVKADPRLTLRRAPGGVVLVACSSERGDHAVRLGEVADELAAEDPLPSVTRAVERLLQVSAPPLPAGCEPFGNERLLRVAVGLSLTAALNPQGIYPKGMPAIQAMRLGAGAFNSLGLADSITPDEIRRRMAARYPEAEPLPEHPALYELIKAAGFELEWDDGLQAYRRPLRGDSSGPTSAYVRTATNRPSQPVEVTPEVAAARAFEEKLAFAIRDGGFLALSVVPKAMEDCEAELVRRFGLDRVSLDALILDALAEEAAARQAKWEKVLAADAAPRDSRDWQNLLRLVGYAMPKVEAGLVARTAPTLLVHPGLLARYDATGVIDRLRDQAGRPDKVPVLWMLIAADEQSELPTIDGKAVPLITPGQRATVSIAWVYNRHRGDVTGPAPPRTTAATNRRSG